MTSHPNIYLPSEEMARHLAIGKLKRISLDENPAEPAQLPDARLDELNRRLAEAAAAPFPAAEVAAAVGRALAAVNDRPNPILDASRTPQTYAALAQSFRDSAWQHLNDGDLPQASNKAWGLVAETIKDISAQHGAIIHTHRAIVAVVTELRRLVANAGDMATARWISATFATAAKLHINFYEDELTHEIVMDCLIQCEELSEFLYNRFGR